MFTPRPRYRFPGQRRRPTRWQQTVACLAAGLIGLLTWLAADPAAHEAFHPTRVAGMTGGHDCAPCAHGDHGKAGDEGDAGHHCIVTVFAVGATDLFAVTLLVLAGLRCIAGRVPALPTCGPRKAYLRHAPTCGPPA